MEMRDLKKKRLSVIAASNQTVGKEGAVVLEPGWAAKTRRLSWLETVEVST